MKVMDIAWGPDPGWLQFVCGGLRKPLNVPAPFPSIGMARTYISRVPCLSEPQPCAVDSLTKALPPTPPPAICVQPHPTPSSNPCPASSWMAGRKNGAQFHRPLCVRSEASRAPCECRSNSARRHTCLAPGTLVEFDAFWLFSMTFFSLHATADPGEVCVREGW